ncbi:uncharacterized protein LOC122847669 [Aphidius gifuensis]|nr:uncharacterized protein LOC122847669 [Aphidius gifuensis]
MPASLSKKQNESTVLLSVISANTILTYSANNMNRSKYPIEDKSKTFKNYDVVQKVTSNCANNNIYALKKEFNYHASINKIILDVIHYDENNKFERINQVDHIFDKAISIASDSKSPGNIYWIEKNDNTYSIKVIDESFDKTQQKYIINPTDKIEMKKLQIYKDKIFFSSGERLWYTFNSFNSTANSLFPLSKNFLPILDFNIDYATDKLYWTEHPNGQITTLYSIVIGTSDLPLKTDEIHKENPSAWFGLKFVVFNNTFYGTVASRKYNPDLYRMNGNEEPVEIDEVDAKGSMSFIFSSCPSTGTQEKDAKNNQVLHSSTESDRPKQNHKQLPATPDNQNNSTNVLLLLTESSKILTSPYSTKDLNLSQYQITDNQSLPNSYENALDFTSTCADKNIYILKQDIDDIFNYMKIVLDVIRYNKNDEFEKINQIENMFDEAISITSDYITGKIYWIVSNGWQSSIKCTDKSFKKAEYIIHPTPKIQMKEIQAYPKRSIIFFLSHDGHLWYTSTSPNSTPKLLFPSMKNFQNIIDFTIDYLTDKLCWVVHFNNEYYLFCASIGIYDRSWYLNEIVTIAKLPKPIDNFVALNNTFHWTTYENNMQKLYFKNGNEAAVKKADLQESSLLSIVASTCPSPATQEKVKKN